MDKEEKELLSSIDSKLSVLIILLLRKEECSLKEKVALLEQGSINYKAGARILGISEAHYGKEKSLIKNNKREGSKTPIETINYNAQNS